MDLGELCLTGVSSRCDIEYDLMEERLSLVARAAEEGLKVVYPTDNELQIDIDSEEQYAVFQRRMEVLERNIPGEYGVEEHPSKSGLPKRHVTITVPFVVDTWTRIALQASLGSDPVRELLSCCRTLKGGPMATLFLEKI